MIIKNKGFWSNEVLNKGINYIEMHHSFNRFLIVKTISKQFFKVSIFN